MALGLLAALAAALFFGMATVLQAIGVRRTAAAAAAEPDTPGASTGTAAGTFRAIVSLPFLAGLALDGLGFIGELIALRRLPLYVVGAAIAGSLAVTAVTSALVLKVRLGRAEWIAVAAVCGGLAMLGATAGGEGHHQPGTVFHWVLLAAGVALAVIGAAAGRMLHGGLRAAVLGLLAGCGFGLVALSVRVLPNPQFPDLVPVLRDPALWALVVAGGTSFALLAQSLVGGAVATATAGLVIGESTIPAVLGILLLGDRTRPGMMPLVFIGFALAVAGALALARFGEVTEPQAEEPPPQGREELRG